MISSQFVRQERDSAVRRDADAGWVSDSSQQRQKQKLISVHQFGKLFLSTQVSPLSNCFAYLWNGGFGEYDWTVIQFVMTQNAGW